MAFCTSDLLRIQRYWGQTPWPAPPGTLARSEARLVDPEICMAVCACLLHDRKGLLGVIINGSRFCIISPSFADDLINSSMYSSHFF